MTSEQNNQFEDENREDRDDVSCDIKSKIYRYKFTDEFTSVLYTFSKIHQYDGRKDFKEAWDLWIEENAELVESEITRLTSIGYEGDILDKMFKSARYYFRKKSTEKKEPIKRRDYVGINNTLLHEMDEHIQSNIINNDFKPSDAFAQFCRENQELLLEEVTNLCKIGLTDHIEIKNKIKKTYKNRYFNITNKTK